MESYTITELRRELHTRADPQQAADLQRYFKTAPGEYGENDRFLGIRVPELRRLAKEYRPLALDAVVESLRSQWHEERCLALLLLVAQYQKGSAETRDSIHGIYLENTRFVNNWDLVDVSAEHIVGAHTDPNDVSLLVRLGGSDCVWERRIAIMATLHWIKRNEFAPTLRIADLLLQDTHDLIQKAVGWMLREVGKRDQVQQEAFLITRYRRMPRTMLRYAIERLPEARRQQFLRGEA